MLARITLTAMLGILITACSAPPVTHYQGVSFLPPARDVSSVFLTPSGDVFLVPEKGVVVQDVLRADGTPMKWHIQGAYLVISAEGLHAVNAVDLVINNKLRRQSLRVFVSPPGKGFERDGTYF